MIMEKLGSSIEDLFQTSSRKFDLQTVCHIGMQMIECIKGVHEAGILHRDINPDNFAIGGTEETKNDVYIIDFGLSKEYQPSGRHIQPQSGMNITGTIRYCSINADGNEQSRRDDIESIGHVLLYLLKG